MAFMVRAPIPAFTGLRLAPAKFSRALLAYGATLRPNREVPLGYLGPPLITLPVISSARARLFPRSLPTTSQAPSEAKLSTRTWRVLWHKRSLEIRDAMLDLIALQLGQYGMSGCTDYTLAGGNNGQTYINSANSLTGAVHLRINASTCWRPQAETSASLAL